MPKVNINVVIVCGSSTVDLSRFTQLLTESYLPSIQVQQQNGCTVTRTLLQLNQGQIFEDLLTSEGNNHSQNLDDSKLSYDLDICFWDMNPKEHLWSRLKALQLYETANIFVMLYNADDKDSFEKLVSIQNDFKDSNQCGAYQVLVSVVTKNQLQKKTTRAIKSQDAKNFIDQRGIPSFIEVTLDQKKNNIRVLDQHLRFIMNPHSDKVYTSDHAFLYRPLFEPLQLSSGKKKKKAIRGNDWVDRLYYQKPDFSKIYQHNLKLHELEQKELNKMKNSKQFKTARESSPTYTMSTTHGQSSPQPRSVPIVLDRQPDFDIQQLQHEQPIAKNSLINLQTDTNEKAKSVDFFQEPPFESDNKSTHSHIINSKANNNGYMMMGQHRQFLDCKLNVQDILNQPLKNVIDKRYLNQVHNNQNMRYNSQSQMLQTSQMSKFGSTQRSPTREAYKSKLKIKEMAHAHCPYHCRLARSRSPPRGEDKQPYPELNSYMTKMGGKEAPQNRVKLNNLRIGEDLELNRHRNFQTFMDSNNHGHPSHQPASSYDMRYYNERSKSQNTRDCYVPNKNDNMRRSKDGIPLRNDFQQKLSPQNKVQAMTGVDMTEQEKINYFKKLQMKYRDTHNGKVRDQRSSSDRDYVEFRQPNGGSQYERVYYKRDLIPLETFKPAKERGYGCSNCNIF